MADQTAGSPAPGEVSIEQRRRSVGLGADDIARIAAIKSAVKDHRAEHTDVFFRHLNRVTDSDLSRRPELLQQARRMKDEHLAAMAEGEYGSAYVDERIRLAQLYSRAGVDMGAFLGAFQAMLESIGARIAEQFGDDAAAAMAHYASLQKVGSFDVSIIQDTMIADREQTIVRQQEAIRELSTPTLVLRDRLLILPIIGLLDSFRARQLTENLLKAIRDNRARVAVMDITGVATVDSKVANHLIQTVAAARLMGARVIVTGLSAEVAQSLVTLGVDLSQLNTVGDLQGGLEEAERALGFETRPIERVELRSA